MLQMDFTLLLSYVKIEDEEEEFPYPDPLKKDT